MLMKENTNKSLAINAIILYVQLIIVSVFGFISTRWALIALGMDDFGLFSVLASLMSFIGIVNTIMISTSHRFIAVAIGKNDLNEANAIFNVNLIIHIGVAVFTFLVAYPIGDWYIDNYINYNGDLQDARMVFHITMLASVLSFISVPYNGLLVAKEKFVIICCVNIIGALLKLLVSFLLLYSFEDKLLVYTITLALITSLPTIVFWNYCKRKFPDIVRYRFIKEKRKYKEVTSFSSWVAYGAIACVAKNQCAALLVNSYFNTVMNAALGVASSINNIIMAFARSVTQPMAPQITKSYAAGDMNRCLSLLNRTIKFNFLAILLISSPFLLDLKYVFTLWLGTIPPYAVSFGILLIVDALVQAFNEGISTVIFADGRIGLYQIIMNSLRLISIFVAYLILKNGGEPYSLFYSYILFDFIALISGQLILYYTLHFNNWQIIKSSYIPSLVVLTLFLPVLYLPDFSVPLIRMMLCVLYLCGLIWLLGLSKGERGFFINMIKIKMNRYG